jgi:DNA polymerase-4
LLFYKNWKQGVPIRLLGVQASSFTTEADQMSLLEGGRQQRWRDALSAADRLRDKFGESSITLAAGMNGSCGEGTQDNPAGLARKGKTRGAS